MQLKVLGAVILAAVAVAGCQSTQDVAVARTKLVCFQAGYGETSPRHDECMRTMLPVAMQTEQQRRMNDVSEGLFLIGAGLRPRQ